jgi:membrane protein implicated in regulation of membrane protease activity
MPLDRFVLLLVCVIAAAGATIWLALLISTSMAVPGGWLLLAPAAALTYVVWRVLSERLRERKDDVYDRMEGDG